MDFSDNYTQKVSDFYWGYQSTYQTNCAQIKDEIENIPEDITKEEFIKKLEKIRNEYRCSSRRYLVEYVKGLATDIFMDGSFSVEYRGKKYHFSGAGMEQIQLMEKREKALYIELLTNISVDNSGDSITDKDCVKEWNFIYRKALLSSDKAMMLQRTDVLRIAHGLKFTLDMAESYLIRATDNDCFDINKGDDLIEMFCFLHTEANNYHTVIELKQHFEKETAQLVHMNLNDKPQNFTALLERDFPNLIKEWEGDLNSDTNEQFMEWLLLKAPYLNMASRTCKNVFTGLAYLASVVLHNEKILDDYEEESAVDIILDFCENVDVPEEIDWYQIKEEILESAAFSFDNTRVKNKRLFGTLWRYITTNNKGEIKTQAIGDAITDLVLGNKAVTKADILFMLWFVCELLWAFTQEKSEFYDQLSDFWTAAEELLEKCRLPEFYAPHLLEQSMLLSICFGSEDESPFEIYENICEIMNPPTARNTTKKEKADKETKPAKNTTSEEATTKQLRKLREAEIREDFKNDRIIWDGTEKLLFEHILMHGNKKGQYIFGKQGISYYPNPAIIVLYPREGIAEKFDIDDPYYGDEERQDERLAYLYSIFLYLRNECKKNRIRLNCRINYRKNCMIQILDYEKK